VHALLHNPLARRNWHGARATSSVDGWASMALRSHVVEAAGVRSSDCRRAWADSSKRASVPDAEPPPRARWSTHYSPRAPVSLTRRLRRARLWLCGLKSLGSRLRPPFYGDVTFFYTVTAPPRPAPPRSAPPRAAPPAPSLRRAACA
jgi:hypothetical protein